MSSLLTKYRLVIPVVALCAVLVGVFWRPLLDTIESGLTPAKQVPVPTVSNPAYRPLVVAHFCLDGPYYYSASNVKLAENAVADKIDSMVVANSGGGKPFFLYNYTFTFPHTNF